MLGAADSVAEKEGEPVLASVEDHVARGEGLTTLVSVMKGEANNMVVEELIAVADGVVSGELPGPTESETVSDGVANKEDTDVAVADGESDPDAGAGVLEPVAVSLPVGTLEPLGVGACVLVLLAVSLPDAATETVAVVVGEGPGGASITVSVMYQFTCMWRCVNTRDGVDGVTSLKYLWAAATGSSHAPGPYLPRAPRHQPAALHNRGVKRDGARADCTPGCKEA